jgi:hypothetical protein
MLRRYYGKISFLPLNQFKGHDGELVIDDLTGLAYVMDGNTYGGHPLSLTSTYGNTSPSNPTAGTIWYNPDNFSLNVYNGNSWIDTTPIYNASQLVNGDAIVALNSNGNLNIPGNIYSTVGSITINANKNEGDYNYGWTFVNDSNGPGSWFVAPVSDEMHIGQIILQGNTGSGAIAWVGNVGTPFDNSLNLVANDGGLRIDVVSSGIVNQWLFGTNARLTLPDNNVIQSLSGITLANSDDSHGSSAVIQIPNNGSGNMLITNIYGGIELTSAGRTWGFDGIDGILTFPDGGQITDFNGTTVMVNTIGGTIIGSGEFKSTIAARNTGNVDLIANDGTNFDASGKRWTFDTTGVITFPDQTTQHTAYKDIVINMDGGGAAGVYQTETSYVDGGFASFRSWNEIYDGSYGNDYILNGGGA